MSLKAAQADRGNKSIAVTGSNQVTTTHKQPDYWPEGELASMPGIIIEKGDRAAGPWPPWSDANTLALAEALCRSDGPLTSRDGRI